jgi:uncharacterized membrane protein YdfJ with MMPL/SSD domain
MDLVTLTTVHDIGLASIVRGVLDQAGIETVTAGTADDVFPVDQAIPIQILVRESDLERAQDVLASFENESEEDEEE